MNGWIDRKKNQLRQGTWTVFHKMNNDFFNFSHIHPFMFVVVHFQSCSNVKVGRCEFFGHVQIFRSYSFCHLESVKWLFFRKPHFVILLSGIHFLNFPYTRPTKTGFIPKRDFSFFSLVVCIYFLEWQPCHLLYRGSMVWWQYCRYLQLVNSWMVIKVVWSQTNVCHVHSNPQNVTCSLIYFVFMFIFTKYCYKYHVVSYQS